MVFRAFALLLQIVLLSWIESPAALAELQILARLGSQTLRLRTSDPGEIARVRAMSPGQKLPVCLEFGRSHWFEHSDAGQRMETIDSALRVLSLKNPEP